MSVKLEGILSNAFSRATEEKSSPGGATITAEEVAEIKAQVPADVAPSAVKTELEVQWRKFGGQADAQARSEYGEWVKELGSAPDLIAGAFQSLGIRTGAPHALAQLPDGDYAVPVAFLGEQASFSIRKRGNSAMIDERTIAPDGSFRWAEKSGSYERRVEGKARFEGGALHLDAKTTDILAIQTEYSGGKPQSMVTRSWTGAVDLSGDSLLPKPQHLEVLVEGTEVMVSKAPGRVGARDERHLMGKVSLITDRANELYVVIPEKLAPPGEGELRIPVKNGGVVADGLSAGFSWEVRGAVEEGKLRLEVNFKGSTLDTSIVLTGGF